jgi:hypothetical protein
MSGELHLPQAQGHGRLWLILLLLVLLLLFALLALPLLNTNVGTTSQTEPAGQCDFATKTFNARQEAFTLGQALELYRRTHPTSRNYGMGSYTICYKNGTQQRFPSPIAPGYSQTVIPKNATHSEQAVYQWLLKQFMGLSLDFSTVSGIYAVIFSQVTVCDLCEPDMVSWLSNLRLAAKTNKVALSIWDIARNRGFIPTVQPAGNGAPTTPDDIERVSIPFAP